MTQGIYTLTSQCGLRQSRRTIGLILIRPFRKKLREAVIENLKSVLLYNNMHHILVHRSKEHTIRTLEWMVKKTFPPKAECEACVVSKFTSKSYLQTPLIT